MEWWLIICGSDDIQKSAGLGKEKYHCPTEKNDEPDHLLFKTKDRKKTRQKSFVVVYVSNFLYKTFATKD